MLQTTILSDLHISRKSRGETVCIKLAAFEYFPEKGKRLSKIHLFNNKTKVFSTLLFVLFGVVSNLVI